MTDYISSTGSRIITPHSSIQPTGEKHADGDLNSVDPLPLSNTILLQGNNVSAPPSKLNMIFGGLPQTTSLEDSRQKQLTDTSTLRNNQAATTPAKERHRLSRYSSTFSNFRNLSTSKQSCARYDFGSTLRNLTKGFMDLLRESPSGVLDLNEASEALCIAKRRVYDVVLALEGIGYIKKISKNKVQWINEEIANITSSSLLRNVRNLQAEEELLDKRIEETRGEINRLSGEAKTHFYLAFKELLTVPEYVDKTLLVVKAPPGSELNIHPHEEGIKLEIKTNSGKIEVTPIIFS